MTLYEDTRQQWHKHDNVQAYCRRKGIQVQRKCLSVGDYMLEGNDSISVDTKESIVELAKNICSRDHERFRRECIRAQEQGIQLIVLIEEMPPNGDLLQWKSPVFNSVGLYHKPGDKICLVEPRTLKKAILTLKRRYGVRFAFCDARSTGRVLVDLLTGGESK